MEPDKKLLKKYFCLMSEVPISEDSSPEDDHIEADHLLCDLLRELGYDEVVDKFIEIKKWYS